MRSFLLGAHAQAFTLGSLVSGLPAAVSSIQLPDVAFAYANVPAGTTLTLQSADLAGPELDFFKRAFGSVTPFTLHLEPGLNLAGDVPATALPSALTTALGMAPTDNVALEGAVGFSVSGGSMYGDRLLARRRAAHRIVPGAAGVADHERPADARHRLLVERHDVRRGSGLQRLDWRLDAALRDGGQRRRRHRLGQRVWHVDRVVGAPVRRELADGERALDRRHDRRRGRHHRDDLR